MSRVPLVADDDPGLVPIEGGASGAPVFGRRATPLDQRKYRRFGVEVESDTERFVEEFEAYFDPDAGAILNLMNSRTEWQQARRSCGTRSPSSTPSTWAPPAAGSPTSPITPATGSNSRRCPT
jgi:hypothetical protein